MAVSTKMSSSILAGVLGFCLLTATGCASADPSSSSEAASSSLTISTEVQDSQGLLALEKLDSVDAIEEAAMKDAEDAVAKLQANYDQLVQQIDSYDKYVENADKVEKFYQDVVSVTNETCIVLRARAANYAELILASDGSNMEKYGALEGIEDFIYDDATDVIEKEIYDGILDEMNKAFYDGVLDDSDDAPSYEQWYDIRSDEYEWWYDARSDVYEAWYDARSDIYSFYYDERSETYSGDMERAQKKLDNFNADIEKMIAKLK